MSGSIKDKSINDVEDNIRREVGEAKEAVEETFHETAERVRNVHVSSNVKLAIASTLAVVASVAIQNLWRKFRGPAAIVNEYLIVNTDEVIVETPKSEDDVADGTVD